MQPQGREGELAAGQSQSWWAAGAAARPLRRRPPLPRHLQAASGAGSAPISPDQPVLALPHGLAGPGAGRESVSPSKSGRVFDLARSIEARIAQIIMQSQGEVIAGRARFQGRGWLTRGPAGGGQSQAASQCRCNRPHDAPGLLNCRGRHQGAAYSALAARRAGAAALSAPRSDVARAFTPLQPASALACFHCLHAGTGSEANVLTVHSGKDRLMRRSGAARGGG